MALKDKILHSVVSFIFEPKKNDQGAVMGCSGWSFKFLVRECKTREIPISGKGQNRNFDYKIVILVKKSVIYSLDLG